MKKFARTHLRRFAVAVTTLLLLAAAAGRAHAAFTFTVTQTPNSVVVNGSGTLNLSSLTLNGNTSGGNGSMFPAGAGLFGGSPSNIDALVSFYGGSTFSGPGSFGTGAPSNTTLGSGDAVGIYGNPKLVRVPQGYVSGTPLTTSNTYAGASFASLGFAPGTYVYTWGTGANADSLIINATVPEPSTWALLGIGVVGVGFAARRRLRAGV